MDGLPRTTGAPFTRIAPFDNGSNPSMARISVVLPAPFGPSTPINSPAATLKLASLRIDRPPSSSATCSTSSAPALPRLGAVSDPMSGTVIATRPKARTSLCHIPSLYLSLQRNRQRVELRRHPCLEGLAGGQRLGDADARHVGIVGHFQHALRECFRRLAVIDQHVHATLAQILFERGNICRARLDRKSVV